MKSKCAFGLTCVFFLALGGCSGEESSPEERTNALVDQLNQLIEDKLAREAVLQKAALEATDGVHNTLLARLRGAKDIDEENIIKAIYLRLGGFGNEKLCDALSREQDPLEKAKIIRLLTGFESASSLAAIMGQLSDKSASKPKSPLMGGPPLRVCDVAYNGAHIILERAKQPFDLLGTVQSIADRDKRIDAFELFWKENRESMLDKLK